MSNIEIWHGTNNNFAVLECAELETGIIKEICASFSTDGLILLQTLSMEIIFMKFYNPDGTQDNCGNGLRVAARYYYDKGLVSDNGKIYCFGRYFKYKIEGNNVKIGFDNISKEKEYWNIGGVLHRVFIVDSFEKWKNKARKLRKQYSSNITLVKIYQDNIFAQTFETGVEDFTYSCGTGSIAAFLETGISQIYMPGGKLIVKKLGERIILAGNAEKIDYYG